MVLAEAMSSGLPVVATDAGAQREVVDDGRTGWLVPPADPSALAARLDILVEDRAIRLRAARAALDAAARLSWDTTASELERHLQQVSADSSSRRVA